MNLKQLHESHVNIIKVDTEHVNAAGTSKKGQIKVPYSTLVELFGEPEHINDGDVNYEWNIEFEYQEPGEDDTDYAVVSIYDWRYHQGTAPHEIDTWNVGAKTTSHYWMLEDYIQSKTGQHK